jgi:hypothetical protein
VPEGNLIRSLAFITYCVVFSVAQTVQLALCLVSDVEAQQIGQFAPQYCSKDELQPDLNLARAVERVRHAPEIRRRNVAIRRSKDGVIREVEELSAKLQPHIFDNLDFLQHGKVPVEIVVRVDAGEGTWRVAVGEGRGRLKRCAVEPYIQALILRLRITNEVRAEAAEGRRVLPHRNRVAALPRYDVIKLPATDQTARQAIATLAERQFPKRRHDNPVRQVVRLDRTLGPQVLPVLHAVVAALKEVRLVEVAASVIRVN